jgi:hypothetical protein
VPREYRKLAKVERTHEETEAFFNQHGMPSHIRSGVYSLRHAAAEVRWICEKFLANEPEIFDSYWLIARLRDCLKATGNLADSAFQLASMLRHHEESKRDVERWKSVMDTPVLTERLIAFAMEHKGDEFVTMQELFNLTGSGSDEIEDEEDEEDEDDGD